MKKDYAITFLFLLFFGGAQAQYMSVFGNDTTVWVETFCNLDQFHYDPYYMYRDTTIDSNDYKIACFRDPFGNETCGYSGNITPVSGYMREDTSQGKVWYRAVGINSIGVEDSLEYLIVDLSLALGDTFRIWNPSNLAFENKLVDSVWTANGQKHVRVDYAPVFGGNLLTFIEGAGLNVSPSYQHTNGNFCLCLSEWKKDGVVAASRNCQVMGSSEDAQAGQQAEVAPHPIQDLSAIRFPNTRRELSELSIMDIRGMEVLRKTTRTSDFEVFATELPKGILFYQISVGEEGLFRGKMLVK